MQTDGKQKKNPKISSHSCSHMISNKGAKPYIEEKTDSSTNAVGETECP
jgi:hypothetical protein